jgi:hypothetical protein
MKPAAEPPYLRLTDLPLWRLIVALDDAERTVGPDSQTARVIARVIQERLRGHGIDEAAHNEEDSP